MQTIKPASNQLFCKKQEAITKTKSGIILSEKHAEAPQIADVINVGSDVKQYKQRDSVVHKPYSTTDIKLDGKEYFLISQEDVLGTVIKIEDESFTNK